MDSRNTTDSMKDSLRTSIYLWLFRSVPYAPDSICTDVPSTDDEIKTYMSRTLSDERATLFLFVWPIIEQRLLDSFANVTVLKAKARDYQHLYQPINMDNAAKHFHIRYQNRTYYNALRKHPRRDNPNHAESCEKMDRIIDEQFDNLSNEDKLFMLMYVTYRYRNNIFHGNKEISNWLRNTTEIDYCIEFMMKLYDCYTATSQADTSH